MRAHRGLKLLVVAALIAFPVSLPASAVANSAFDQYVETPPDSGSNNSDNGLTGGNNSTGKDEGSNSNGRGDGSGTPENSSTDPMVAWANGESTPESPAQGSVKVDGGSNAPGSSDQRDRTADGTSKAPSVERNGILAQSSSSGDQTPVFLLAAMVLAAISLVGLALFRKRRLD
jgi:hypothetical protein